MEPERLLSVEEIFNQVMKARSLKKQELAALVGVHKSVLSSKLGTTWNLHWMVFIRLLPDLVALKIIDPKELKATADKNLRDGTIKPPCNNLKSQENQSENKDGINVIMLTGRYFPVLLQ